MKRLDDEPQLELPVPDVYVRRMRAAKLKAACRAIAEVRGFARMAQDLDDTFCAEGRPVSLGMLHNTLNPDHERNYFRGEWLPVFAEYDETVAEIIANASGRTLALIQHLKPEDELALLKERITREFGIAGARLISNVSGGSRRR